MASATATETRPMIELHMQDDPEKVGTPVIITTWTFTDQLVDKLAKRKYSNPHVLLVVGYETFIGYNKDINQFKATKVYDRALGDPLPKEYLEFSKVGTNVALAFVVNVENKEVEKRIAKWQYDPEDMRFDYDEQTKEYSIRSYTQEELFNIASFRHDVIIPAGVFAREPTKASRALVRQYYGDKEFDQCHFRARLIKSIALTVPVQIYGVFARVFTLLYALVFAKRGINLRTLFALNPHDFGHDLGTSFWYHTDWRDSDINKRKSVLKWLSPPQLILYVLIAGVLVAPGWLLTWASSYKTVGKESVFVPYTGWDIAIDAVITDVILGLIVAFFFYFMSETGTNRRKAWAKKRAKAKEAMIFRPDPTVFDLLREQAHVSANATPSMVANKTFILKFKDLKMKVCRPFARIS